MAFKRQADRQTGSRGHQGLVVGRLSGFPSDSDNFTEWRETEPEMFCYVSIKLTD